MLSHLFPNLRSIVFDPIHDIQNARKDPELFINNNPPPLILDEIQYAPELVPIIKRRVDLTKKPSQSHRDKSKNNPNKSDTNGMAAFRKYHPHLNVQKGLMIAPINEAYALNEQDFAIPWDLA